MRKNISFRISECDACVDFENIIQLSIGTIDCKQNIIETLVLVIENDCEKDFKYNIHFKFSHDEQYLVEYRDILTPC